jgi:hypothetical protein
MNIIRFGGHAEGTGEMNDSTVILVRIPEGRRKIGRFKHCLEDNIEMYHK